MDADFDVLIDRLRALSLAELIDVLSQVLPGHTEEESVYVCRLVLSVLSRPINPEYDPEYRFQETVAWPDYEGYGDDVPRAGDLAQQGECPECGLGVISTVKRARCPQCGAACALS
jgi:hypothetical protein